LYSYLKKENPDVIHAFLDFPCISSGYVSLYLNIRKVLLSTRNVSPNHFLLFRPYFREFYKSLLKFKNITLVNNSKTGARSYENWLNIKKNSIKVTYNIFDFNQKIKLKKIKKKLNSINFVSIFRLDPEKNPEYVLRLAKNLIQQNSNYYFYIIGVGLLKTKLEKYIKKNLLNKNIRLLGIKNNIYDYLNFADYTLLTSRQEGTPNVLLESQKVGTPIITTDAGGAKEAFIRNYSGYLIGNKSIKEDCNIINNIVQATINKKLDLNIIKKKLNKFSPLNSTKQVLNLYK
jgi:glycosyltransferase involved in cell wall biosynthesis